jgi:hypothetical protein
MRFDRDGNLVFWNVILIFFIVSIAFFADNSYFTVYVAILGTYSFYLGFRFYNRKKMIENIPFSKIRYIAGGLVEIKGKVLSGVKKFKSPLTNKNCIHYRMFFSDNSRISYRMVGRKIIDSTDFHIRDNTGKILVNVKNAEYDLQKYVEYIHDENKRNSKISESLKRYLKSNGILAKDMKNFRVREYCVPVGSEMYIMGSAMKKPKSNNKKGVDSLVINKDPFNKLLQISDTPEKSIVDRFYKNSMISFATGIILITIFVYTNWLVF